MKLLGGEKEKIVLFKADETNMPTNIFSTHKTQSGFLGNQWRYPREKF